jgi:Carboxypeptidase regulatory-like domain
MFVYPLTRPMVTLEVRLLVRARSAANVARIAGAVMAPLLAVLLLATPASAQRRGAARLRGVVAEQGDNPIQGATLTLFTARDTVAQAETGSDGAYVMADLPPGRYTLSVQSLGYSSTVRQDVQLVAGETQVINFALSLAPVQLKGLEAIAAPVQITHDSKDLASTLTEKSIELLPAPRTAAELVTFTPGARPGHIWGGSTAQANNYVIDGLPVNHPGLGGELVEPSIQWIDHIDVAGLGVGADQGDFQGGIVSVTTKSGTNQLQGAFHSTIESRGLDASNLGRYEIGSEIWRRHDEQGEVRGPLLKDHIFYYLSGELIREDRQVLNHVAIDTAGHPFVPAQEQRHEPKVFGKLTFRPGRSDVINLSGGSIGSTIEHYGMIGYEAPDATLRLTAPTLFANLTWQRAWGDHALLDVRLDDYSRDERRTPYLGTTVPSVEPYALIPPYTFLQNAPLVFRHDATSRSASAKLSLNFATGPVKHELKLGGEESLGGWIDQRLRNGGLTWRPASGSNFNVADPSTWYFYAGGKPFIPVTTGGEVNLNSQVQNGAAYVQDNITLSSHFSIGADVRYGWWIGMLTPAGGSRFTALRDAAADPRLGVTWDITGHDDWVLKAFWGRYHQSMFAQLFDRVEGGNVFSNEDLWYLSNPGLAGPHTTFTPAQLDSLAAAGQLTLQQQVVLNQTGPVQNYHQPYVDQWLVGIEKMLAPGWRFKALYVNRRNYDMVSLVDRNAAQDYTTFGPVRVYGATNFLFKNYALLDYNGYPLVIPRVYIPNDALVYLLEGIADGSGAPMPPGLSLADTLTLKYQPDYVLTNAPNAQRKFDQVQLSIETSQPRWGASASLVFTNLRGNLDNVTGYEVQTLYDDPNTYGPGPYVRPNESVNWYGPLQNYADTEWKLSIWGQLPWWNLSGGAYWDWASGDHYTPLFTLSGLSYVYIDIRGDTIDNRLFLPLEGQRTMIEQRGSLTRQARASLDLHLEREFDAGHFAWLLTLDLFNVFNASSVTDSNPSTNKGADYLGFLGHAAGDDPNSYFDAVWGRMPPRTLQLGTEVRF